MQDDFKLLNLKKTFSFLQNLDYSDEDDDDIEEGVVVEGIVISNSPVKEKIRRRGRRPDKFNLINDFKKGPKDSK
jgi:hypothetical protein